MVEKSLNQLRAEHEKLLQEKEKIRLAAEIARLKGAEDDTPLAEKSRAAAVALGFTQKKRGEDD